MPGPHSDQFRGQSGKTPLVPTWMDDLEPRLTVPQLFMLFDSAEDKMDGNGFGVELRGSAWGVARNLKKMGLGWIEGDPGGELPGLFFANRNGVWLVNGEENGLMDGRIERLERAAKLAMAFGHPWIAADARRKIRQLRKSDSDGSPKGRDAQRLDDEAATARAEGIAQNEGTPNA